MGTSISYTAPSSAKELLISFPYTITSPVNASSATVTVRVLPNDIPIPR